MKKNRPLIILLIAYYTLTLFTLFYWTIQNKNTIRGDEPHFLTMARGIGKYHTFEQTPGYTEELNSPRVMKNGLIREGDTFNPQSADALKRSNGIFSIHNVGLPLLITLPSMLGGVLTVKFFMVLLSGSLVILIWKIAGLFTRNTNLKIAATLVSCFALPFSIASTQIYPDLLAGIIALFLFYVLLTIEKKRSTLTYIFIAILFAFLPWLQVKNVVPALLLLIPFVYLLLKNKKVKTLIPLLASLLFIVSFGLLFFYYHYAYDNYFFGPYDKSVAAFNIESLRTFVGLHIDQNQGFLIQNPLLLLGVFYIGIFIRKYKKLAIVLLLTYLSFMIPNAIHTNWYGGNGFAGRFAWSGATLFVIPALFGYIYLYKKNKKIFDIVTVASILFQVYLYVQYTFGNVDLYNREANVWLETYSIYFHSFSRFLPSFYNPEWAFSSKVNLAYIGLFFVILAFSFIVRKKKNILSILVLFFASVIVYFGLKTPSSLPALKWTAVYFASDTGKINGSERIGVPQVYRPGFIINRLFINLLAGTYTLDLRYLSQTGLSEEIGTFELYNSSKKYSVGRIMLFGSKGREMRVKMNVQIQKDAGDTYEIRAYWNGKREIIIKSVELSKR